MPFVNDFEKEFLSLKRYSALCHFDLMPLFFFHICDDAGTIPDEEGTEFQDVEAAMKDACQSARDVLAADIREDIPIDHRRIEVTEADGTVVGKVIFRDLIH